MFNLPGKTTVPIPTKDDPKATILSLCRRLLNSPRYVYTTAVEPDMLQHNKGYFKIQHKDRQNYIS